MICRCQLCYMSFKSIWTTVDLARGSAVCVMKRFDMNALAVLLVVFPVHSCVWFVVGPVSLRVDGAGAV